MVQCLWCRHFFKAGEHLVATEVGAVHSECVTAYRDWLIVDMRLNEAQVAQTIGIKLAVGGG